MSEVKSEPEPKVEQEGGLPSYVNTAGRWKDAASIFENETDRETTRIARHSTSQSVNDKKPSSPPTPKAK